MNKTILIGRMTKDPEQRTTGNGIPVTSFTIAVQRKFKDAEGNYPSDFINCVAWRGTAEFLSKHFAKGQRIGIVGSLQSRSFDDAQGNRRFVTEVVVDDAEFVESKGGGKNNAAPTEYEAFADGDIQPLDDAELPF